MISDIKLKITHCQNVIKYILRPPQQRPNASAENLEAKRLRQIVVGTAIQAFHNIFILIFGCQHQDWRFITVSTQLFGDFKTIHNRHHHVENDEIVIISPRCIVAILAIMLDINRVAVHFEPLLDRLGNSFLVVNNQNLHNFIITFLLFNGLVI